MYTEDAFLYTKDDDPRETVSAPKGHLNLLGQFHEIFTSLWHTQFLQNTTGRLLCICVCLSRETMLRIGLLLLLRGRKDGRIVAARRHKIFGDSNGVIKLNSICLSTINFSRNASGFGAGLFLSCLTVCTHHARVTALR